MYVNVYLDGRGNRVTEELDEKDGPVIKRTVEPVDNRPRPAQAPVKCDRRLADVPSRAVPSINDTAAAT
jgi:hypothetical protein